MGRGRARSESEQLRMGRGKTLRSASGGSNLALWAAAMGVSGAAKVFGRLAGRLPEQLQSVADGADGAAAVAGYLRYGQPLNAVEAEDGKNAGRFGRALEIEAIEEIPGGLNRGVGQVIGR